MKYRITSVTQVGMLSPSVTAKVTSIRTRTADHWVAQQYLPGPLQGHHFYEPGDLGWEGERKSLLADHRRLQLAAADESSRGDTSAWSVAPRRGNTDGWTYRAEGQLLTQVRELRDAVITASGNSPHRPRPAVRRRGSARRLGDASSGSWRAHDSVGSASTGGGHSVQHWSRAESVDAPQIVACEDVTPFLSETASSKARSSAL
jgi:hypothetical protein